MKDDAKDTDVTHDQMEGGIPANPDHKEAAIYSGPHLDKIRDLYARGAPIALPEQITGEERATLDAQRAKSLGTAGASSTQTSTGAGASANLSRTNAGTSSRGHEGNLNAARTSPVSGSTAAPAPSSAGTAGNSSSDA